MSTIVKINPSDKGIQSKFDPDTGRQYITFTATGKEDFLSFTSDCRGETKYDQIQIEKGGTPTFFVEPVVMEGILSGLFKDMKQIQFEMKDLEKSDFGAQLILNTRNLITEFKNGELQSELSQQAEGFLQQIQNAMSGIKTEIATTAEGLERRIKDAQTQRENSLKSDINSTISQITSPEGTIMTKFTQLDKALQLESLKDKIQSVIKASGGEIALAVKDNETGKNTFIDLVKDGVKIKSDDIVLDGNVTVTEDFWAKNFKSVSIDAGQITSGTIGADHIVVNSIDLSKATAASIETFYANIQQALVSWLKGKTIVAEDGGMKINLNDSNIEFMDSDSYIWRTHKEATAFIRFDSYWDKVPYLTLGVTSHNEGISNLRDTARFAGIEIHRPNDKRDEVRIWGDQIYFTHGSGQGRYIFTVSELLGDIYVSSLLKWLSGWINHGYQYGWGVAPGNDDFVKVMRALHDEAPRRFGQTWSAVQNINVAI